MRILFVILAIISHNAFGSLNQNILNSVKLCTLAIVSSKQSHINEDTFYQKNLSTKLEKNINYGTGFFYSQDKSSKTILTNFHVIDQAIKDKSKLIGCNSEGCHELEILMIDKKTDIATLKANGEFNCDGSFSLEFNPIESAKIFTYGNKFGLNNSFSFGVLGSKNAQVSDTANFHLIDVSAGEGNSGGAVFLDKSTKVIGMVKSIYSSGGSPSLAFAITSEDILKSIKKMQRILTLESELEFDIIEEEDQIHFLRNNKNNGFFEKFNLLPSDQIQYIDKNPANNKIEILYDIYEFLTDQTRLNLKIILISNDGKLKNITLTKYRSYTEDAI